jgi:hypothetical protein
LTRIDNEDLNLFEFDYDLTFMVFFLNAEGQIYARYGGRDAEDPDRRQSLEGLRYTMESVLRMHGGAEKAFAPRSREAPRFVRQQSRFGRPGRCLHCHQVKEILNAELQRQGKWSRDLVWRYPLPENVGFALEVDRGNVVKEVKARSPAAAAGLKVGDAVRRLGGVPIHSFADAQLALDRAPATGSVAVAWERGGEVLSGELALPEGWRKTDITWRPSVRHLAASPRLYGPDLTAAEKKALGLSPRQLAFRQRESLSPQAEAAGIRAGDIILGFDDRQLDMDAYGFLHYVAGRYLIGDRVTVNLLRDGRRLNLGMTLRR